jgi:hypothetical protein
MLQLHGEPMGARLNFVEISLNREDPRYRGRQIMAHDAAGQWPVESPASSPEHAVSIAPVDPATPSSTSRPNQALPVPNYATMKIMDYDWSPDAWPAERASGLNRGLVRLRPDEGSALSGRADVRWSGQRRSPQDEGSQTSKSV